MKTKHTPRPWTVIAQKDHGKAYRVSNAETGEDVADIYSHHKHAKANADLIAAAPDLLEALKHCVAYMEKYRPEYCGIADDRECSPYMDALEALSRAERKK